MRYQERIYEQTQISGVKNRTISNVNMSSDLCVFSQPTFSMSGATKIDCSGDCSCPSGYVLDVDGVSCTQLTLTSSTFNGFGQQITGGNMASVYSSYGAYFYPNIENNPNLPVYYTGSSATLLDSSNNVISPITVVAGTAFWGNGVGNNGRLNNVGLSASTTEYLGFSKCINIQVPGTYYVGLAADNSCRFKLNGKLIANFSSLTANDNFKTWSVFQFELLAGMNIIELEGKNTMSSTAFGAEIYKPTSFAALTGSTTTGTTGLIFSTKDYVGNLFDLGTTVGYSCPPEYSLNICTSGTPTCVKISKYICPSSVSGVTNTGSVHTITTQTSIPINFNFTGNTSTFSYVNTTFKYEIYKYSPNDGIFINTPIFKSENIAYESFSGTNILNQSLLVSTLQPDGEYLVKGYYEFDACTEFMSKLGKKVDTLEFKSGSSNQLYDSNLDFYLAVITQPSIPKFLVTEGAPLLKAAPFFQEVIFLDGEEGPTDTFEITGEYNSDIIITLNGAILTVVDDYNINNNIVTMNGLVSTADTITAIYNKIGGVNISVNTINVLNILSGATGTQGNRTSFYNTTTNKYEIFLKTNPIPDTFMIIKINHATLAQGVDFYQSVTDPKRIILEGDILMHDMIVAIYYPQASLVNGVTGKNSSIVWMVDTAPVNQDGKFILELSSNILFTDIKYSAITNYDINVSSYNTILQVAGAVGDKMYYRVRNEKTFTTICGKKVINESLSEVIPITITSNSLNSY